MNSFLIYKPKFDFKLQSYFSIDRHLIWSEQTRKAFKTHNRVFTLMCILPIPDDTELWQQIFRLFFGFTVSVSVSCGLVSSIVYVSKYAGDNLEESVKTIFQIAAYANVTYMMVIAFLKQRKIKEILRRFQETYDNSKQQRVLDFDKLNISQTNSKYQFQIKAKLHSNIWWKQMIKAKG